MAGENRYIFTGGPGGGKTSVIQLLRQRGYATIPDSARRLIRSRVRRGLEPRPEPVQFATSVLMRDIRRYDRCPDLTAPVFFDRGIPDALGMLHGLGAMSLDDVRRELAIRPYNNRAFFFPPWKETYTTDAERDQDFEEAVSVAALVVRWYEKLDYELIRVPPGPPIWRLEFVIDRT